MINSQRLQKYLGNTAVYIILTFFALVMLFPFLVMLFTSFKQVEDTFVFPPRLLPREPITMEIAGFDEPLPIYNVDVNGEQREYVLVERSVKVADYAAPDDLDTTYLRESDLVQPTGGVDNPQTILVNG